MIADKNTREIIKFANPLLIWDWEESQLMTHDDVRWYETFDEANADATERYATEPTAIVQTDVYMVGTDRTALATYYWNGTKLTQRLASVPLLTRKRLRVLLRLNIVIYMVKAISVEASGFSWHLPDGREYLQMALHRDIINQCYVALGLPILPTGNVWTCLQYNATTPIAVVVRLFPQHNKTQLCSCAFRSHIHLTIYQFINLEIYQFIY